MFFYIITVKAYTVSLVNFLRRMQYVLKALAQSCYLVLSTLVSDVDRALCCLYGLKLVPHYWKPMVHQPAKRHRITSLSASTRREETWLSELVVEVAQRSFRVQIVIRIWCAISRSPGELAAKALPTLSPHPIQFPHSAAICLQWANATPARTHAFGDARCLVRQSPARGYYNRSRVIVYRP